MPIEIKNYPSLLAVPYLQTLDKESIQRKDFQRIVLENALSLNAIISLSNYYQNNRPNEDNKNVTKLAELKNFDLSQISVGTWNMFSRETQRVFGDNKKALFLNDIFEMYHGSAKSWEQVSGDLITIRNKDAHGELIAPDKLTAELDRRQIIIDKLMEHLDFFKDYQLIVPYQSDVIGGKVQYSCKNFYGANPFTVMLSNFKTDIELFTPYLYHTKSGNALDLSPILIAQPTDASGQEFSLFIYSKTTNKAKGNLHYLSLNSSVDFESDKSAAIGQFWSPSEVCQEFARFRIYIEDKSLHDQKKPAIAIERVLKNEYISKEELAEIKLKIKNEGEVSADNIWINFKFPTDNFNWVNKEGEEFGKKDPMKEVFGEELSIDPNQTFETSLFFAPKDAGQYEFPPMVMTYEFMDYQEKIIKPGKDKEGNELNTESSKSVFCTIYDPGDPYSLAPVINVMPSVDFGIDENGKNKKSVYIGESITFTVDIINNGFGVAKDVDFSIFTPKEINLKTGSSNWVGNINPTSTQTRNFELELLEPGIHSIRIREIIYKNNDGNIFNSVPGDYKLLVRNNPKVQYQKAMERIWEDLKLDEDEVEELNVMNKKFGKLLDLADMEEIEFEVKLKVLKSIVNQIAAQKSIKLIEKTFNDMLIYLYKDALCTFIIIDFKDKKNIKLIIRGDMKNQFPIEEMNIRKFARHKMFNIVNFNKYDNHKYQDFPGGIGRFKGMLGMVTAWMENHDYMQLVAKDEFINALGIAPEMVATYPEGNRTTSYIKYKLDETEKVDTETETEDDNKPKWEYDKNFVTKFLTYFDEQDNLNLVVYINEINSTVRKNLKNLGYQCVSILKESDFPNAKDINMSSFFRVYKGRVKSKEDLNKFKLELQKFVCKVIELHNEEFLKNVLNLELSQEVKSQFTELNTSLQEVYREVEKQEGLLGVIFDFEESKNELELTYYAIKDFPLYQNKQKIMNVVGNKKKFEIGLRNCSDELIEQNPEEIEVRRNFYPFGIKSSNDNLKDILSYSLNKSKYDFSKINYTFLKFMVDKNIINNYYFFLKSIYDNDNQNSINGITKYFEENNLGNVKGLFIGYKLFHNNNKFDTLTDYDLKTKSFKIKEEYLKIIEKLFKSSSGIQIDNKHYLAWNLTKLFEPLKCSKTVNYLSLLIRTVNYYSQFLGISPYKNTYKDSSSIIFVYSKNTFTLRYEFSDFEYSHEIFEYIISKSKSIDLSKFSDLKIRDRFDINKNYKQKQVWRTGGILSVEFPIESENDFFNIEYIRELIKKINYINIQLFPLDFYNDFIRLLDFDPETHPAWQEISMFPNVEDYPKLLEWRKAKGLVATEETQSTDSNEEETE